MSATEAAISVLRQSVLRRIAFTFPGGGGFFSIPAGMFAGIADRMAPGPGAAAGISVEIDPTLACAGDFRDGVIVLREPLSDGRARSALCHEALHAHFFYNDLQRIVYDNHEEAACYTVNALYHLLMGLPQDRWATRDSTGILQAAWPIAQAILSANAVLANGFTVSPRDFQPLVEAVARAYPSNNSQSSYARREPSFRPNGPA